MWLGMALLGLLLLFGVAWRYACRIDNESLVDVVWALAFCPVALVYALAEDGWVWRRVILAGLLSGWSLRLGIHLWRRVARHHPELDRRYLVLRQRWAGDREKVAFLKFFLSQAVLVWLLMLPVWWVMGNPSPRFHGLEICGFAVWLTGVTGEAIADRQLRRFRWGRSQGSKEVCREGLWRYSRHPNYFFQSLLWWGLFLMALPMPYGWVAILAPLTMLFFLLKVTGIPLTEELALKKRGEAYRDYQRTTSAFIPLPNKTAPFAHESR